MPITRKKTQVQAQTQGQGAGVQDSEQQAEPETQHLQTPASLITEVMGDLLVNPTFQKQLQDMVKSMVKEIADATYHRLKEYSEENRGAIHDLEVKVEESQKELRSLHQQIETQQNQLDILKKSANDQEQYSRRNCLRIFGIEEKRNEDPDRLLIDVFKDRLQLDVSAADIERSHRVGKMKPGKHRALIIKLCSYRVRRNIIQSRRKLKGTGISIQEDLTAKNQALYHKVYTSSKVVSAWTNDGKIFAQVQATGGKTSVAIVSSDADLVRLNI